MKSQGKQYKQFQKKETKDLQIWQEKAQNGMKD